MATDDKAWNLGQPPIGDSSVIGPNAIDNTYIPSIMTGTSVPFNFHGPVPLPSDTFADDMPDGYSGRHAFTPYVFTPETEALLAVLLRPQGLTEQLAVAVLRAVVAGHRKEMLAAAAALADHVQEESQQGQ